MNHFYIDRRRQERKRKLKSYMNKRKTADRQGTGKRVHRGKQEGE